jgi:hypothetical protein
MEMETARPTGTSWPQTVEWQVFAVRAVGLPPNGSHSTPGTSAVTVPQQLPLLDWPPDLFGNEPLRH